MENTDNSRAFVKPDVSGSITFDEYLIACETIIKYIEQQKTVIKNGEIFKAQIPHFGVTIESCIEDLTMDIGLFNSLKYCRLLPSDPKVKDLSNLSIKQFRSCRNVGNKKIEQLMEILRHFQLSACP